MSYPLELKDIEDSEDVLAEKIETYKVLTVAEALLKQDIRLWLQMRREMSPCEPN